jgi:prophage antirepressor-like protein
MENNMTLEVVDKQEVEVIYTRDMMDYEINVYGSDEEPLFLAKDIAEWLENKNPSQMLNLVDDDEKGLYKVYTPGGRQNQWLVTEDGLYEICMRSNLPKAKKVRKFIKSILKEIRTKGYVATNNNTNYEIANAMTMITQTIAIMQKENNEFKDVVLEKHYELEADTQAIKTTLSFLRIDGYELSNLTLLVKDKREKQRKYFDRLAKEYNVRSSQISKVWDSIMYSGMYEAIGREKLTPYENKSIHCGQSLKDITRSEYPVAIKYIENFNLDRTSFEQKIDENYKNYKDNKKQQMKMDLN